MLMRIEDAERVVLTGRDSLRVLDMLKHPPAPNAKLRKAIATLALAPFEADLKASGNI